ncbi:porin [Photobacterium sp. SDRW27]|uniref:porin n=1 Tax=Photobacterium obscurum TaxID=2829490 RepID=UPI002244F4A9|nr:porin [Photobacterium obscurum]MCW8328377.1 porin [Photobacterium obscurum]
MKKNNSKYLLAALLVPAVSWAGDISPTLYGTVQGQIRLEESKDYANEIDYASVGVFGFHQIGFVNTRYKVEAEYSQTNPDPEESDEIILSEANLLLLTKDYGIIYFGNGVVGTWNDLYKKVDIFASNNMKRAGGNSTLFRQKYYGTNQLAYTTPTFGNLSFKIAAITPDEENGADVDVFGLRALYNTENFSLVLNRAEMDEKFIPTGYTRWALASSYRLDNVYLGGMVEYNDDDPAGDSSVYAVSGSYALNKLAFRLGYQTKIWDSSVDNEDESLILASVTYQYDPNLSVYLEAADYAENTQNDNLNLGLTVSF